MISGGVLKRNATRLEQTTTADALGIKANTWTAAGTFRCDLREQTATEGAYADGVAVIRSVELRARWDSVQGVGLTELDRISVRGRTLKVNGIRNLEEADRVAVIDCTEVD